MKLELKHLAPYLPYGLKVEYLHRNKSLAKLCSLHLAEKGEAYNKVTIHCDDKSYKEQFSIYSIKPILRPLSDLTKEIEYNGEMYKGDGEFTDQEWYFYEKDRDIPTALGYESTIELIKRHFDIFRLIEKELAIDMNTLEPPLSQFDQDLIKGLNTLPEK